MSPPRDGMRLRVLLPGSVLLERTVSKVIAEAENGYFCLLPRHIDYVATLASGILAFEDDQGIEHFAAINCGVLVKCDRDVNISTMDGVLDDDLERLHRTLAQRFGTLDDHERAARSALARIEAGVIRHFIRLEHTRRG